MKKSASWAAFVVIGFLIPGCPVYDAVDLRCFNDFDCPYGYVCDGATALCVSAPRGGSRTCDEPDDCASNETCSRTGTCQAGDCHFASVGCVKGYECSSASGRWECVPEGGAGEGGAGGSPSTPPSTNAGAPSASGGDGSAGASG